MLNTFVYQTLLLLVPLICTGNPINSKPWQTHEGNSYLSQRAPEECPNETWQNEVVRMVKNADAPESLLQHTEEFREPNIIQVLQNMLNLLCILFVLKRR
jgi:hypothetical protein